MREFGELERKLGYRFKEPAHLAEALTHRSYRFENSGLAYDNERLEFLGDAVLGLLATAHIFAQDAGRTEGAMTALRTRVTSGKALAGCASAIGVGAFLRMGQGEERSGGRARPSNLANAFEAIMGAAYLDGGVRAAGRIFARVVAPRLAMAALQAEDNPKGRLQEYAQAQWKNSPTYNVVATAGPAHATEFTVAVTLPNGTSAMATGRSKQEAESAAAALLLQELVPPAADSPIRGAEQSVEKD